MRCRSSLVSHLCTPEQWPEAGVIVGWSVSETGCTQSFKYQSQHGDEPFHMLFNYSNSGLGEANCS